MNSHCAHKHFQKIQIITESIRMQKMNQGSHRLADSPLPPDGSSQKPKFWFSTHASPGGTSSRQAIFGNFSRNAKTKRV